MIRRSLGSGGCCCNCWWWWGWWWCCRWWWWCCCCCYCCCCCCCCCWCYLVPSVRVEQRLPGFKPQPPLPVANLLQTFIVPVAALDGRSRFKFITMMMSMMVVSKMMMISKMIMTLSLTWYSYGWYLPANNTDNFFNEEKCLIQTISWSKKKVNKAGILGLSQSAQPCWSVLESINLLLRSYIWLLKHSRFVQMTPKPERPSSMVTSSTIFLLLYHTGWDESNHHKLRIFPHNHPPINGLQVRKCFGGHGEGFSRRARMSSPCLPSLHSLAFGSQSYFQLD